MGTDNAIPYPEITRRRQLLPWWIKFFIWIFLILQAISVLLLAYFLTGYAFFEMENIQFNLAIYGLETTEPASVTGLIILIILQLELT